MHDGDRILRLCRTFDERQTAARRDCRACPPAHRGGRCRRLRDSRPARSRRRAPSPTRPPASRPREALAARPLAPSHSPGIAGLVTERRLLQRLERKQLRAHALALGASVFEPAVDCNLLGAQRLHLVQRRRERVRQLFACRARHRFLLRKRRELLVRALRRERLTLDRQAIGLRHQPAQLVLQLLDARALHLVV